MKKFWLTLAIPCLLLPSCHKEVMEVPDVPQTNILVFTANSSVLTRTDLDENLAPVWKAGDQVWISDGIHSEVCTVAAADDGKRTVEFTTTTLTGNNIYAVSPASSSIDFAESREGATVDNVFYNIPNHTDGSFSTANICVAYTTRDNPTLNFHNATSVIEFTKTSADVTQITLESSATAGNNLAGWHFMRYSNSSVRSLGNHVSKSVTVDLNGTGPWYAAINPGILEAGGRIVMTGSDGLTYTRVLSADNNFKINTIKSFSVDGAKAVAESVGTTTWVGNGTETDPYLIASTADLNRLASQVNGGTTFSGTYFKLIADIDVSATYLPIGRNESYVFKGNFDGDFHTITISGTHPASQYYGGLFGWVEDGLLKRIKVAGSIGSPSGYYTYMRYFGSICAYATRTTRIQFCSSALSTNGWLISKKFLAAGGIVGYAGGTVHIYTCFNTGNISFASTNSGNSFYVGGICGQLESQLTDRGPLDLCYNTGTVNGQNNFAGYGPKVAGIASSNSNKSAVLRCYNTGSIGSYSTKDNGNDAQAAGIAHSVKANFCYNAGNVSTYYVSNSQFVLSSNRRAGVAYIPNNGTYNHCFSLSEEGKPDQLFVMAGSGTNTITNCYFFTQGDATNGGYIADYETCHSLLDAMNKSYASSYGGETWVIGPPPGYYPVLVANDVP